MSADIEPLLNSLRDLLAAAPEVAQFDVLSLVRPSIRLATKRVPYARLELGDSRIGGIPDAPPQFEWPRWLPPKRDNQLGERWHPGVPAPLGFIAQVDLGALPHVDDSLPDSGWLYFFYDRYCEPWGFGPADRGCCRVFYARCERDSLVRLEPPADADADHMTHPCLVEARPELTLPEGPPQIDYGSEAYDVYCDICDRLAAVDEPTCHRLLGHPQLLQNPMELECQLASNEVYCGSPAGYQSDEAKKLEAGAADWRLLLQIDTDEDGPGWMWGDVGRIYFWIKRQDLAAHNFDNVWLILQCS